MRLPSSLIRVYHSVTHSTTLSSDTAWFISVCLQLSFQFFILTITIGTEVVAMWENKGPDFINRLLASGPNTTSPTAMTVYNEALSIIRGITGMQSAHFDNL